jgi:hypothetical protein
METLSDDVMLAQHIVHEVIKAKKQLKLYPSNNPIYIKTIETTFNKFNDYFERYNELSLKIFQNEIKLNDEQIYHNPHKEDNLALFFFKDGIMELNFHKGFTQKEFESFMKVLNTDFENIALDDDVVTLFWEHDFEHITYIVDENFLLDENAAERKREYEKVKENLYSDDDLTKAYRDGLKAAEQQASKVAPMNEKDLKYIESEIEKEEAQSKIEKTLMILLELLYQTKDRVSLSEITNYIENTIAYCIKGGDFQKASFIVSTVKSIIKDSTAEDEKSKTLQKVFTKISSEPFIQEIGKILDSMTIIDEDEFKTFFKHLDKSSIPFLLQLMGELQSIRGKRLIIEALSIIGRLDIETIAQGLTNSNWNIVQNTLTILGKIADTRALKYLTNTLSHPDLTVRKATIQVMGEIGTRNILPHLKSTLTDKDQSIRIITARALGNSKSEGAKMILLGEMSKKQFSSKPFDEKKQFYEAIASWNDQEVKDFLSARLKMKKFWGRTKNDETRACAAYAIGLIGDKDAISYLRETMKSKNNLLKTSSVEALKRLTA